MDAQELRHVTRDRLPPDLSPSEIDAAVRERTERGEAIYELDEDALHDLEPDLIVTQALCPVCAVSYDDVREIAERLPSKPRVIALDPKTFGETLGDIKTIAQATGAQAAALLLVASTSKRIPALPEALGGPPPARGVDAEPPPRAPGGAGRPARAPAGGVPGVARPGLRRGPLDAAA